MSTQYRLVQSGKTASGGCSAGPRFVSCSATDFFWHNLRYCAGKCPEGLDKQWGTLSGFLEYTLLCLRVVGEAEEKPQ
jgi:hypothetical protein